MFEAHSKLVLQGMLLVREYLQTRPCVDCGESDPRTLDFDHIGEKNFTIGNALTTRGMDLDILAKEISLCVVRCSNCHRKKTLTNSYRAVSPEKIKAALDAKIAKGRGTSQKKHAAVNYMSSASQSTSLQPDF